MTPAKAIEIAAAYRRHEDAAGGYALADMPECVRLAAEECGVSYEDARGVLLDAWSAPMGSGG